MAERPRPVVRKRLPVKPSLEHLQKQAKRRAKRHSELTLAKAQHELAKEYGCKDWVELAHVVETMLRGADQLAHVKYDFEALPQAVNEHDLDRVRAILASGEYTPHDLDLALGRATLRFDERGAIAKELLEYGADPNGQYGSDYGPIVFGTGESLDPDGLAFLMEAGADVTFDAIPTKYGMHNVMSHWLGTYVRGRHANKRRGVRMLLEAGAPLPEHVLPEMLAIHLGDTDELARLLDADPERLHRRYPDMPYGNNVLRGGTLLHMAIEFYETECVDLLLDRGADINAKADMVTDDQGETFGGQTPMVHVIGSWHGHGRALLRHLVNRLGNAINWEAQGRWCQFGEARGLMTVKRWLEQHPEDLELVRAATSAGAEANDGLDLETLKAFGQALTQDGGDIHRVHRMLDEEPRLANCNPWAPGWVGSAIEAVAGMAVWHRPAAHAIAKLLLERGAACSAQVAARAGLLDEIKRQAEERGWIYEEIDAEGRSMMYRAACVYGKFNEGEAVADYLIEKRARVDLYVACTLGMLDVVRDRLGDDPGLATTPDPEGMTALHWAVRNRRNPEHAPTIVELLLDAGADIEAVNPKEDGMRPLHHAGEWSAAPVVIELLIRRGARVNALAAQSKKTPLDYATQNGRQEAIAILKQHGGMTAQQLQ